MRLSIHITTKNRNDALAMLLESLRVQTHKEWDLVILDNNNGTNEQKTTSHFLCSCIFNRLQYDGHRIHIIDNSKDEGTRDIGRYRNMVIDQDPFNNEVGVRIDDDSVCERKYLEILHYPFAYGVWDELKEQKTLALSKDVGIVGGIVPYYWAPVQYALQPAKFNEITSSFEWTDNCVNFFRLLDQKGNDKPWQETYFESGHVRSSYAYRMDLAKKIKFPENTGSTGFTEESTFCIKVWMNGYKVIFNPNAICWHISCPYGGGRDTVKDQPQMDEIKVNNLNNLKNELNRYREELGVMKRGYP